MGRFHLIGIAAVSLLLIASAPPLDSPRPSPLQPILDSTLGNPLIALLLVLSVGLLVGEVKILGVTLGLVGVFLVGMPVGHAGYTAPPYIDRLGAIFLMFGVGLGAGPTFFRAFGTYGKPLLIVLASMVLAAAAVTFAFVWLAGIPVDLAAGVFTGSLKSSSGFASALDQLREQAGIVSVGYSVAYPISLLGIVLFVQIAPRLLGKDVAALNQALADRHGRKPKLGRALVEITNPAVQGKLPAELDLLRELHSHVNHLLDGDHLVPVPLDWRCAVGAHVQIIGPEASLKTVTDFLGRPSDHRAMFDATNVQTEIVLTSSRMTGRMLAEVNPLANYGVHVFAVSRQGHDLVARPELVLQPLDVLEVRGPADNVQKFAKAAGHRAKALQQTDMLSLAVGIAAGVVVGTIPLGWPGGAQFRLGMGGGPLVVALVLSHFGRVGRIVGTFPPAVQLFLVRLGLSLLIADSSIKAGGELGEVFGRYGVLPVLMTVTASLAAVGAGFVVSSRLLRHDLLQTLAILCGGLNATPAYEVLSRKADADEVLALFTTSYAIAMILTVLATQILIAVLLSV